MGYIVMLGLFLCLMAGVLQFTDATHLTCPPPSEGSAIKRLKSSLFCDYDPFERPVKIREDNVTINTYFFVKHVAFIWKDEFLSWNPEEFENIDKFYVLSHNIWTPDAVILGSNMKPNELKGQVSCTLNNTGDIHCVPQVNTIIYCAQNLTYWPRDTQGCKFIIRSYTLQNAHLIDFQLLGPGVGNGLLEYQSYEWQVTHIGADRVLRKEENNTYSEIHYHFEIRRSAYLYAVIIMTPAFVMASLTLLSLCVHDAIVRVWLLCTALLGNALCLLFIGIIITASETFTPKIALFYRNAMLVTMFTLVLGVSVEKLKNRITDIEAPGWLVRGASWLKVRGGKAGQLLLGQNTEELSENLLDLDGNAKTFKFSIFENFLGRLTFLAYFILYSVMFLWLYF